MRFRASAGPPPEKKSNGKLCADGYFDYTMISLATGRAEAIPAWIAGKYAI